MNAITLNDGTYIFSEDSAIEWARSLGMSFEDLNLLCGILNPDFQYFNEHPDEFQPVQRTGDDWEAIADGYYNAYNNLCQEVEDECERFLNGRKKTKAQFVSWLKFRMEDALLDY